MLTFLPYIAAALAAVREPDCIGGWNLTGPANARPYLPSSIKHVIMQFYYSGSKHLNRKKSPRKWELVMRSFEREVSWDSWTSCHCGYGTCTWTNICKRPIGKISHFTYVAMPESHIENQVDHHQPEVAPMMCIINIESVREKFVCCPSGAEFAVLGSTWIDEISAFVGYILQ